MDSRLTIEFVAQQHKKGIRVNWYDRCMVLRRPSAVLWKSKAGGLAISSFTIYCKVTAIKPVLLGLECTDQRPRVDRS